MDASSVPIGRAESDLSAPSTSDTDQWNGDDPPAVVLDGVRSPFPLVVLKHVFMFKSKSLINPKTFCVFLVYTGPEGDGWTEMSFHGWRSKGTLVRFEVCS